MKKKGGNRDNDKKTQRANPGDMMLWNIAFIKEKCIKNCKYHN
jgi:hypothetical protein